MIVDDVQPKNALNMFLICFSYVSSKVQSMGTLLEDLVSRDAILAELACIVSDPGMGSVRYWVPQATNIRFKFQGRN